ncbi:MAG TPA: AsmA family protein [Candidatus Methylomirabilis sp.]|nr:AsmA family protein [Candidatus Methylomirabilis sp.]
MRLKTVLLVVVGLLVVLVVAAVVVVKSIDFNTYKPLIAEQAKAATGRELTIRGNLDLQIGFSPAVVVKDVSFANASWGSRPEMVKLGRFEVELALLPLIFRQVQVKRLILVQPDILLETDAKGTGNWTFGAPAAALPPKQPTGEQTALPSVAVQKVRVEKGTLVYRDGKTKQTTTLALDHLDIEAKEITSPLTFDLAAAYNGKAFTLAGTVGALAGLTAPSRPYPLKLTLKAGGATVEVDGSVAKPMEAEGLNLKVVAKGAELAEVAKFAGRQVPPIGPFALAAQVSGSPKALSVSGIDASVGKAEQILIKATGAVKDALNAKGINVVVALESKDLRSAAKAFGAETPALPSLSVTTRVKDAQGAYAFEELKASVGKSTLAGSGAVSKGAPRPRVSAKLASPLLDLSELLPAGGGAQAKPSAARTPAEPSKDKRMFPADPLPLAPLKAADADLDVKIDRLVLPNKMPIEALAVRLVLAGGRLEIQPFSSRVGGGAIGGRLALDASSGNAVALATKIDAKGVDLGQLMQQAGNPDLVTGAKTDLAIDLRGGGGSVRDVMAGLNGDLLLVLGEGKLNNKFVDFLGADLLKQVIEKVNPFRKTEPQTDLKCGVIKFAVKDGMATTDRGIAFETSKMTVVSSGTANLKTEAIDFSLRPNPRDSAGIGAGELVKLMRVRGTLAEPKVGIDEMQAAKSAVSIGTGLATGGISALAQRLAGGSTAEPNPCATALGKGPAPARGGAAPATAAPAGKEAPMKGGGAEQLIKGLFGK